MSIARFTTHFLFVCCFATGLVAGEQIGALAPTASPVIAASATESGIRFSALSCATQIRVILLSSSGDAIFDSAWKDGDVLDLTSQSLSPSITSGSYRSVVMVKDLDGQVAQREVMVTASSSRVSLEQRTGVEEAARPIVTMLAHDERDGFLVNTRGDLSFRFGDFLAGKDKEQMRLTADGKLGIGTDQPQATLDVNGFIRTSRGIMFPDGTVLTTAPGAAAAAGDRDGAIRERAIASGATAATTAKSPGVVGYSNPRTSPPNATSGRLSPHPTFAPDFQFKITDTGVNVGTTNPSYLLAVTGPIDTGSYYTLFGRPFAHTGNPAFPEGSTFLGLSAGNFTMTPGSPDTAIGYAALTSDTTGENNTAVGYEALFANTDGCCNTAIGHTALMSNTHGNGNLAIGMYALQLNTTSGSNTAIGNWTLSGGAPGSNNTAIGWSALEYGAASNNTAVGVGALAGYFDNPVIGSGNIALGYFAGSNLTTGSGNIDIGSSGVAGDALTTRLGGGQTRAFISGIRGVTTGTGDAIPVLIDSTGQLGTASSSIRYKTDIADMGDATDGLNRLRPVTFRYKQHGENARLQYGLIAEEVAEVFPELVARDNDGRADTVMYQFLPPMLLNELQKQRRLIENQQAALENEKKENAALRERLDRLEKAFGAMTANR